MNNPIFDFTWIHGLNSDKTCFAAGSLSLTNLRLLTALFSANINPPYPYYVLYLAELKGKLPINPHYILGETHPTLHYVLLKSNSYYFWLGETHHPAQELSSGMFKLTKVAPKTHPTYINNSN